MFTKVVAVLLRPPLYHSSTPSVYLAQRLDKTKPYHLMFAPPGGKMDDVVDASPKLAALRELREETGLELTPDRLFYVTEMDSITPLEEKGSNIPFTIYWFAADLKPGEEPRQIEPHKQGVWIPWTLVGIQSLQMPPGDREAVQKLLRGE